MGRSSRHSVMTERHGPVVHRLRSTPFVFASAAAAAAHIEVLNI